MTHSVSPPKAWVDPHGATALPRGSNFSLGAPDFCGFCTCGGSGRKWGVGHRFVLWQSAVRVTTTGCFLRNRSEQQGLINFWTERTNYVSPDDRADRPHAGLELPNELHRSLADLTPKHAFRGNRRRQLLHVLQPRGRA